MYMSNIISDTLSFEDLVRIVNSLNSKINELERKINILESNSLISDYDNEVIIDDNVFRTIPVNAPQITRQNAFSLLL